MTDLLISTPEEFRAVASSHTFRNLDTIRGYLVDSQNTFLRQRLGQPLIKAMLQQYTEIKPIVPDPSEYNQDNYETLEADPWAKLIQLAQRCIAYDALYRSAGIRRVSDNDMGINVAESDNFAAVDKDRFAEYKIDLYRAAHAASDMLLTQLQDWERQSTVPEDSSEGTSPILTILTLWRQSPTYPLTDGLLFTTATEFNPYVNIQQSLDKFIDLLPDIRFCQELHLEAEIGSELLAYLHQSHREGTITDAGEKAYQKLQRTLSLYVEARNSMFKRSEARDEAQGYMHLTNDFIRRNQRKLFILPAIPAPDAADREAILEQFKNVLDIIQPSPLFDPSQWSDIICICYHQHDDEHPEAHYHPLQTQDPYEHDPNIITHDGPCAAYPERHPNHHSSAQCCCSSSSGSKSNMHITPLI